MLSLIEAQYASQRGLDRVSFALPQNHFVREVLQRRDVPLAPEPPASHRETFMVRPPPGKDLGELADLQWSLADKF